MDSSTLTIGVVAPAKSIDQETAEKVRQLAWETYGKDDGVS